MFKGFEKKNSIRTHTHTHRHKDKFSWVVSFKRLTVFDKKSLYNFFIQQHAGSFKEIKSTSRFCYEQNFFSFFSEQKNVF